LFHAIPKTKKNEQFKLTKWWTFLQTKWKLH
jgi:hypothetical protein